MGSSPTNPTKIIPQIPAVFCLFCGCVMCGNLYSYVITLCYICASLCKKLHNFCTKFCTKICQLFVVFVKKTPRHYDGEDTHKIIIKTIVTRQALNNLFGRLYVSQCNHVIGAPDAVFSKFRQLNRMSAINSRRTRSYSAALAVLFLPQVRSIANM